MRNAVPVQKQQTVLLLSDNWWHAMRDKQVLVPNSRLHANQAGVFGVNRSSSTRWIQLLLINAWKKKMVEFVSEWSGEEWECAVFAGEMCSHTTIFVLRKCSKTQPFWLPFWLRVTQQGCLQPPILWNTTKILFGRLLQMILSSFAPKIEMLLWVSCSSAPSWPPVYCVVHKWRHGVNFKKIHDRIQMQITHQSAIFPLGCTLPPPACRIVILFVWQKVDQNENGNLLQGTDGLANHQLIFDTSVFHALGTSNGVLQKTPLAVLLCQSKSWFIM